MRARRRRRRSRPPPCRRPRALSRSLRPWRWRMRRGSFTDGRGLDYCIR
uniref:Uncharacterized protein n=1 Tax=Arundo donax TaxID=35708 RepID=A0A0A9H535_ARUDO